MKQMFRVLAVASTLCVSYITGMQLPLMAQASPCVYPYQYQPACKHPTLNEPERRAFDNDIAVDIDLGSTTEKFAWKAIHSAQWGPNFTAAVQDWNAINGWFSTFESATCSSAKSHSLSPICARMLFWSHYQSAGHPPETTAHFVEGPFYVCPSVSGMPPPPPGMWCRKAMKILINGGVWWETNGCGTTGKNVSSQLSQLFPAEGSQEARGMRLFRTRTQVPTAFQRSIKGDMLHELGHGVGLQHYGTNSCKYSVSIEESPLANNTGCAFTTSCTSDESGRIFPLDIHATWYLYGGP